MTRTLRTPTPIVALIALALAAGLTGCAAGPDVDSKALNNVLPAKPKPFDPANATDLYTNTILNVAYEGLFQYKYLTDTYELEPLLADGMPVVSADGLTYTFKIRRDAFFYDPQKEVFPQGKGRAVKASDFVFALKRLADPAVKSGGWWLFSGFIRGLDDWAAAIESGTADYETPVAGLRAEDDQTLVVTLVKPYPQILYAFAMGFTFAYPPELLATYGEDWINHMVGTGPYYFDELDSILGTQYVFKRTPGWRNESYPTLADIGPRARAAGLDQDVGKRLPLVGTVNYHVIQEGSTQWLKLMTGELDSSGIPTEQFDRAVENNELAPKFRAIGLWLDINPRLDVTYDFFNMEDPVWGAPNPNGTLLRLAVQAAIPRDQVIKIFYNNAALAAQTLIPPGLGGYDPTWKNPNADFNPEKARTLIAQAGYAFRDTPQGRRAFAPDGTALSLTYESSGNSTLSKEWAEFYKKYLNDVGIEVEIVLQDFPTFLSKVDQHVAQFGGLGWGADYPDAQNFLQIQYGPNAAPGPNNANYSNSAYDRLYERAAVMLPGPERDALYTELSRMQAADAAFLPKSHRLSYRIIHPWLRNYFFRDVGAGYDKYRDIDPVLKEVTIRELATAAR
ncbi:MAG TPA: ABC transporter substrate-binding protein [Spirochaetales bacterium]|nr:ABC transporter substrate-binding protein [Spirochaetales bacterium]